MANKSMFQAIQDFSKKLSKVERESSAAEGKTFKSQDKVLQSSINQLEDEKKQKFLSEYNSFKNPVTSEIEKDEENLLDAFNLFAAINETESKFKETRTKLSSHLIKSPLCEKTEYTTGQRFIYLRFWFLSVKKDAGLVPQMTKSGGNYFLEFIAKEDWKPSVTEKQYFQYLAD